MKSQFVLPESGPLEEFSFCAGGSNRKVTVTADTRGHGECGGGPIRLKEGMNKTPVLALYLMLE